MPVLDGKGLSWFTSLVKKYIGTPWSMSGDVNDTIVLINDNLNDYTTIGNYYCRPDSDAATVSNNPAGSSFILKVYSGVGRSYDTSSGNYLTQHLEDLYGNIWIRYKSTGNWSDWNKVFTVTGDSTVGSGTNPIYMNNGVLIASSSTVGSGTKPIYLNGGVITVSGSTVGGTARGMYLNSGTLTALSGTVGDGTQPVYMSSGTITASTSTVGSGTKPMYMSSGTLTASSSTVGSGTKPVYLSSGTVTVSSSTVGSGTNPVYMSSGTITASGSSVGGTARGMYLNSGTLTALSSTVGSGTQPVYMSSGTITASSSTVGAADTPVYLKSGVLTACSDVGSLSVSDYKLNETGYVKFSMGLIIQWGNRANTGGTTGEYTVTFPIAFSSGTSYVIVKNGGTNRGGTLHDKEQGFYNKTATGATTTNTNSVSCIDEWLAIGY